MTTRIIDHHSNRNVVLEIAEDEITDYDEEDDSIVYDDGDTRVDNLVQSPSNEDKRPESTKEPIFQEEIIEFESASAQSDEDDEKRELSEAPDELLEMELRFDEEGNGDQLADRPKLSISEMLRITSPKKQFKRLLRQQQEEKAKKRIDDVGTSAKPPSLETILKGKKRIKATEDDPVSVDTTSPQDVPGTGNNDDGNANDNEDDFDGNGATEKSSTRLLLSDDDEEAEEGDEEDATPGTTISSRLYQLILSDARNALHPVEVFASVLAGNLGIQVEEMLKDGIPVVEQSVLKYKKGMSIVDFLKANSKWGTATLFLLLELGNDELKAGSVAISPTLDEIIAKYKEDPKTSILWESNVDDLYARLVRTIPDDVLLSVLRPSYAGLIIAAGRDVARVCSLRRLPIRNLVWTKHGRSTDLRDNFAAYCGMKRRGISGGSAYLNTVSVGPGNSKDPHTRFWVSGNQKMRAAVATAKRVALGWFKEHYFGSKPTFTEARPSSTKTPGRVGTRTEYESLVLLLKKYSKELSDLKLKVSIGAYHGSSDDLLREIQQLQRGISKTRQQISQWEEFV